MSYTRSNSAVARPIGRTSTRRGGGSRTSSARGRGIEKAPVRDDSRITPSTGNVFLDIGFPPAEAENLLARTDLMIQIEKMIRQRKLTQARAAKLFGVTQPRISDLVRGKIELFSVDSLIAMLGHAGAKVELRVRAA